jgi:hypothetical protein
MPVYPHPMMMPQNFYGAPQGFTPSMMNPMGMPTMNTSSNYMPLQNPGMMPLQPPGMIPITIPRR